MQIPTPEPMASKVQQLRRGVQVGLRAEDVVVAHVSGKPGKAGVQIDSLAIPAGQAMNREGVAPVIRPRSHPAARGLQTGFLKESS